jgi:glycosyltransferase involved in cell wall biosynthesis
MVEPVRGVEQTKKVRSTPAASIWLRSVRTWLVVRTRAARTRPMVSPPAHYAQQAMPLFRRPPPTARLAFNMRPLDRPWGGGNWWLTQIVGHLREHGYDVRFDLRKPVDCVVVVDPRVGGNVVFGADEIAAFRVRNRDARVLHRVNECDLRKGTNEIDALLEEANRVADHTVFISAWLRDYHADRWFDLARPHTVIHNGADTSIFHPGGDELPEDGPMRLVTHHWSANPMKGFDVYEQVDRLIAGGELEQTELWVIGRWPGSYEWQAARTFPPVTGPELGDLLREGHVYLTGSRFEPGGMHVVEALQCGLPLLYHEDGGGIVELGQRYGIGFRDDVAAAIREMRGRYAELRRTVLGDPPSGDEMCRRYREVVESLSSR